MNTNPPELREMLNTVWSAIDQAQCPGREGPYGGYDYGHNEAFYGEAPKDGRYVVRDFLDPRSDSYGARVHQTHDRAEHEAAFAQLTHDHIAQAAIEAIAALNTRIPDPRIERIERMEAALGRIAEGDEPRPVGKSWNTDGKPSKHDKCIHDRWMYEDCGNCVADFARTALTSKEHDV